MAGSNYYFCVAHEAPWFVLPAHVETIATGNFQAEGLLNIRDSKRKIGDGALNASNYYPYLAGTAGSLYISELLQERDTEDRSVCIFQYRKLIAATPVGAPASNFPHMRILTRPVDDALVSEILNGCEIKTLISHPIVLPGGMLAQYASAHRVSDLLLLTHIAVKLDVLAASEVSDFFNTKVLIPGGVEFGVFPCAIFISIMEQLRAVLDGFLQRHAPADTVDLYQRRGLSFFAERLGSYMLLKDLGIPRLTGPYEGQPVLVLPEGIGHMCTVSDSDHYQIFGQTKAVSV